ncbi:PLD nuclease N-terminal domain-containing protein [Streptomyces maremycinicus]|uniref:PLD nuclease N-terminal domain-containing protein n=1 Tax=Streptomyces maremycinicus TaxID=1679753 RepID=UPI000787A43B|nr:PLD nuclease N-terminal domain-containing protein [Streptomyces sp. NBRC 110468]
MLGLLEPPAVAAMVLVTLLCVGALLDCVRTPAERVRCAPKALWLLFLLSAPIVGGLAWTYLGKRPEPRESPDNTTKGPTHRAGPFVQKR